MSTATKPPVNGPFADTEVSIYCDESRHEGNAGVVSSSFIPN